MAMQPKVSHMEFIKAWQSSESNNDVLLKLGMNRTTASQRASALRSKGIPLKKMPYGNRKPDWASMAEYARQLLEGDGKDKC